MASVQCVQDAFPEAMKVVIEQCVKYECVVVPGECRVSSSCRREVSAPRVQYRFNEAEQVVYVQSVKYEFIVVPCACSASSSSSCTRAVTPVASAAVSTAVPPSPSSPARGRSQQWPAWRRSREPRRAAASAPACCDAGLNVANLTKQSETRANVVPAPVCEDDVLTARLRKVCGEQGLSTEGGFEELAQRLNDESAEQVLQELGWSDVSDYADNSYDSEGGYSASEGWSEEDFRKYVDEGSADHVL